MMKQSLHAALLLLGLAGCSDHGATSNLTAPEGPADRSTGQGLPTITSAVASAMFTTGTSEGIVDGLMYYDAHHASIQANVSLSGATSAQRSFPAVARHTTAFYENQHSASFRIPVPGSCGHTLSGDVRFAVWAYSNDGDVTNLSSTSRNAQTPQDRCVGEEEATVPRSEAPDGGGGGGDGCPTCVLEPADGPTWCKVRTKYYLDTGEIISRTTLHCW